MAAYSNGKIFRDTTNAGKVTTVDLNFLASGQVTYKLKIGSGAYTTPKTVAPVSYTHLTLPTSVLV